MKAKSNLPCNVGITFRVSPVIIVTFGGIFARAMFCSANSASSPWI